MSQEPTPGGTPLPLMQDFVRQLSFRFVASRMSNDQVAAYAEDLGPIIDPNSLLRLRRELSMRCDRMPSIAKIVEMATAIGALQTQAMGDRHQPRNWRALLQSVSCPICGVTYEWSEAAWMYQETRPEEINLLEQRAIRNRGKCLGCLGEETAAQKLARDDIYNDWAPGEGVRRQQAAPEAKKP